MILQPTVHYICSFNFSYIVMIVKVVVALHNNNKEIINGEQKSVKMGVSRNLSAGSFIFIISILDKLDPKSDSFSQKNIR